MLFVEQMTTDEQVRSRSQQVASSCEETTKASFDGMRKQEQQQQKAVLRETTKPRRHVQQMSKEPQTQATDERRAAGGRTVDGAHEMRRVHQVEAVRESEADVQRYLLPHHRQQPASCRFVRMVSHARQNGHP